MKKILALSLSFVLHAQAVLFAVADGVIQGSEQVRTEVVSWKDIKGKKLELPEMDLLSGLFELSPIGILRMDLVQKSATKMLKEIEDSKAAGIIQQEDKAYVQEKIVHMIKPIEDFFTIARDYESILKPLLEASLGVDCFILQAYKTDGDICKFLESNVDTLDKLQTACVELLQFFKDLKSGLGQGARKAYVDLRKQLANKNKA